MHKYFVQFQWISGNVYLLTITFFQNKIPVWATDCPTIPYLNAIMHVDPLERLCTKWVVKGKTLTTTWQLGHMAGKCITSRNRALWCWVFSVQFSTVISLSTDGFVFKRWFEVNSAIQKNVQHLFPFKCCLFIIWLACFDNKIDCYEVVRIWRQEEKYR